ncbi:MAG: OmpW family outer membrane protein [Pseudomonas sp.]|nr:OmpW family outer membrane protein [Pseudomonas sp.]
MRKSLLALSILATALAAPLAQAYQAGDIIVRAGAITVDPHESSSNVKIGGVAAPGTGATLDSDTQLGLTGTYMFTSHVGIELLAATPFSHTVGTKGLGGLKLGTLKHLPPTLSVVYYPLDGTSAFQPYVGAGINYTWFFDTELSSEAETAGFRGLDMKDSWGFAAQVGMDYMLTDNLLLNASMRYIDIETTGTTYAGPTKVSVDVDVDPFVYMVGLGYKF